MVHIIKKTGTFCLMALPLWNIAQSPQLFKGGQSEGWAKGVYLQNSTAFWMGGNADGFSRLSYQQSSTKFWTGGISDGSAKNGYVQPTTQFWKGGNADGFAGGNYIQTSVAFWMGGEGDGYASTYVPNTALPVSFGQFSAIKKSETEALLNWETLSEYNADYFDIERSVDAIDFVWIGKTRANGNSNAKTTYQFTDSKVLAGNNYYRLKQVDKNGVFRYTPARLVRFGNLIAGAVKLFPNPATAIVNIQLPAHWLGSPATINLVNNNGQVVMHWRQATLQQAMQPWNISTLPPGIYLVHLLGGGEQFTQKLVIQ